MNYYTVSKRTYAILIILIIWQTAGLVAQSTLKIGDQAPKIFIDKWILNKPNEKKTEGKFIILDFWATWCKPCLENVSHINDLRERYIDENLLFLQMTSESVATAKSVFDRVDFKTPVVTDKSNKTHINFGDGLKGIAYYPMVVLIDDRNIVRWFGSSEKLSISMIEKFLKRENIRTSQMNFDGPYDIARDTETYILSEFSLEKWGNLFHDPNIIFTSYIEEVIKYNDKPFDVIMSNGSIIQSKSLKEIFKILYPDIAIVIPEYLKSKKYNFYFVNKELDSKSENLLINDIADQLNLNYTKTSTNGFHMELIINDMSLLKIQEIKKRKGFGINENGNLVLPNNNLEELSNALTKHTDYFWFTRSKEKIRYEFEIDISNYNELITALNCYGLEVEKIKKTIDVISFIESDKE